MSTPTTATSTTRQRKAKHLSICINPHEYTVEHGSAGFEAVRFVHSALPELDAEKIDTTVDFLGTSISAPLLISCMTGGSDDGFRANKNLARAAQRTGVPVGTGSFRVLFEHEEVFEHFHLKPYAPDVPVLANIGGVQVRDLDHRRMVELCRRLEVDALVVHLNPGQELFQPDGDRDFRGIRDAIGRLCDDSPLPVIVKETGFGIAPATVADLFDLGVRYVDLAGAGGTNWISVERYRADGGFAAAGREFEEWGLPTAVLLAALRARFGTSFDGRVIASGGIRSGQDVAKSVALGALAAGAALPLIRAEVEGGVDGVVDTLEVWKRTVAAVMALTGSRTVESLRAADVWTSPTFAADSAALAAVGGPA